MTLSDIVISKDVVIRAAELRFRTARSGGPGGQNVNKLETRVELEFDVASSPSLTDGQKQLLYQQLGKKISMGGILRIVSQESRSQWDNRRHAVRKFAALLKHGLIQKKRRRATKPPKQATEKRLEKKKIQGEKKRLRRPPSE